MANEAKHITEHYLAPTARKTHYDIYCFGANPEECLHLLSNLQQFEEPDITSSHKTSIIGLEHFEYDAYRCNRKGSSHRKEYSDIEQSSKKKIEEKLCVNDSAVIFDEIKSKPSEAFYRENFIRLFSSHYSSVKKYKAHISKHFKIPKQKIPIWFIAEDVTPLGTSFVCRNKLKQGEEPAFPLFFPDIEKLFLSSSELEGIIFADHYSGTLTIVKRNKEAITSLKLHHHYQGEPLFFHDNAKIASIAVKMPF